MTTPQPPKKRKIQFNDPDFHQQKKDFYEQIRKIIFQFYNMIPRSRNRDALLKFADYINPSAEPDAVKLPYIGRGQNATSKNKIACVFALISWVIRRYWVFCENPTTVKGAEYEGAVHHLLGVLNQILFNGLDKYQIKGDLAKGFYLEKK